MEPKAIQNTEYRFSYAPQYSDLFYLGFFLIGGGTIALLQLPLFIPLVWISVIGAFYLFIRTKPSVFFFEQHIELRRGFGKKKEITSISYSDVQLIQYCFAEVGGTHLFKITFRKHTNLGTIQYSFQGRPSRYEVLFLEEKKMPVKVVPENARYKLDQNI